MTGAGRQAGGNLRDGRFLVRGRSNYDICGSLLAINSARNVVLIPPPAQTSVKSIWGAHGCNKPAQVCRGHDDHARAWAGSCGGGATEGRQREVLEALADQKRVKLARQGYHRHTHASRQRPPKARPNAACAAVHHSSEGGTEDGVEWVILVARVTEESFVD